MKKFLFSVFVLFSFVFASCGSNKIYINTVTLTPSEIDMSSYRNIAVPSTQQWSGSFNNTGYIRFESGANAFNIRPSSDAGSLPISCAKYISDAFVKQIEGTNYFARVIAPPESDVLATSTNLESLGISREELLKRNDVNAMVNTSIDDMNLDEYVTSSAVYKSITETDKNGKKTTKRVIDHYNYQLHQNLSITITMKVVDIARNSVIATKTISDSTKKVYDIEYGLQIARSPYDEFVNLLNKMSNKLAIKLIPHYTYTPQEAMANKPELKEASIAYEYLVKGMNDPAYAVFSELWRTKNHVPSGYNAALLLHGKGQIDDAITLMQEVYDKSYNANALGMLAQMKTSKIIWDSAAGQLK